MTIGLVPFVLEVLGQSIRPLKPRYLHEIQTNNMCIGDLVLVQGSLEFSLEVDGQVTNFCAIKDINLEWLLLVPAYDKVICIALQELRLRIW